ncbi:hypothetical protein ACS0TY_021151 [Phlomoides rotata]
MMMTFMDRMNSLTTQQARETLPPLVNHDPNLKMSQSLPQMEDVKYMGGHNGQGGGWYGQGKQFQQQGPSQPQVQYNTQGPSHNQGQGWFQNAPQQFPGGGSSYSPNARKHENFSYSNPKAAVQFPPGFNPGAKLPTHEGKPTNEDTLNLLLKKMESIEEQGKAMAKNYKGFEAQIVQKSQQVTQVGQQQRTTDFQLGQLATTVGNMQNKGKFPSTTELNPKEYFNAIKLRSGTSYQEPSIPKEHDGEEEKDKVEDIDEDEEIEPCKEDEEEKGLMKNDKEDMKKKLKEVESSHRVPKWKLAKGLKEKEK